MEIIIFSRSQSIIINSVPSSWEKNDLNPWWISFVILKRMCPLIQRVMKQSVWYSLYSFASLLQCLFHKIIPVMVITPICIITIFVVLHYFKSIFILSVFSSENSPLSWNDDDNHFYITDTVGQGGLENFSRLCS